MSSVFSRGPKQIPTDSQYFVSLLESTTLHLNIFNPDANSSTTSYVSGAAAGSFSSSNVTPVAFDASGSVTLFRDMGITILSSGRTFRAVQLLRTDAVNADTAVGAGSSGWTSSNTTPGVWQPSNEGILGSPTGTPGTTSDFGVFYFETGARGLGVAQGLVRYG
jgi:hypothetical protein